MFVNHSKSVENFVFECSQSNAVGFKVYVLTSTASSDRRVATLASWTGDNGEMINNWVFLRLCKFVWGRERFFEDSHPLGFTKTKISPLVSPQRRKKTRGVNHCLEFYGNPYNKSKISYAQARNPFEKWEISYAKCWSDLTLEKT